MKKLKQKLYILPGFEEKISRKCYQDIIKSVKDKFIVVPINYDLSRYQSFLKCVERAHKQIIGQSKNDVILGFSVGALIALELAAKINFKQAIFCSISAILQGDLLQYPEKERRKLFSAKQIQELNKTKYKKPKSPFYIICGEEEGSEQVDRSRKLHKLFDGRLILIKNGKHELCGDYLRLVKKILTT